MKQIFSMKWTLWIFLFLPIFVSCVSTSKKIPSKAPQSLHDYINSAQIDFAAGDHNRALNKLKMLINKHPDTDLVDDAYIKMGQIYMDRNDYPNAYKSFMSVVNSDVFSPRESDALLGASRALFKMGSYDEVLSLTNKCLSMKDLSTSAQLEIHKLRFQVLSELGDHLDALKALIFITEHESNSNMVDNFRRRAIEFVDSRLKEDDLSTVARDTSYSFVRNIAAFRLGNLYFEQRDYSRALDLLQQAIELNPNDNDTVESSQTLLKQIEALKKVDPYTIGAILPLSGKASSFGYKTLRGIQLGLGIYGPNPSKIKLALLDGETNPDLARRAVERLVVEDQIIGLIGSLSSKTAVAVASKANEMGVPSIALSQKSGVTEIGPYVFRNALTSEMLVRRLVQTAINDLHYSKFALIYPNDAYGVEYANLFWDEVLSRGGEITAAQSYEPKETDFSDLVKRLVDTFYLEDRIDEYKSLLKEWQKKSKSLGRKVMPPDDLLPPVVDFDAIFIPDSIKALNQIAPMLAYHEVNNVKLLGTNLWNTPELMSSQEKYLEKCLFIDGMLVNDPAFKDSRFYRDFTSTFHEEPGMFESQGYDAGLMLREIIENGERTRSGVAEKLSHLKTFKGSLGSLYVNNSREVERPTLVLNVDKNIISVFDSSLQQSRPRNTPSSSKK